jgi:hypothetical protein
MPRRPPTYLTADELKQIAAIKSKEGLPSAHKPGQSNPAIQIDGYLASKEPPK